MEILKCSSLEKVFWEKQPDAYHEVKAVLIGEPRCFQIAWRIEKDELQDDKIVFSGNIAEGCRLTLKKVQCMPSGLPAYLERSDDNYITKKPGFFPDLITDFDGTATALLEKWEAVWVELVFERAGTFESKFVLHDSHGTFLGEVDDTITVMDCVLPQQTLIHTEWIHYDCLATYYDVPVFSERHWEIIENYVGAAVKSGINMILTPLFTPPLDTAVGGERPTVQLVDVTVTADGYTFGFERLLRFLSLCQRCGAEYFEMSHLFTQWGASAAPKVMGRLNSEEVKLFGWETDSAGEEYGAFLASFLPALTMKLKELAIAEKCFFHISDEPHAEHIDSYQKACAAAKPYLKGFKIIDALSNVDFFKQGLVSIPIAPINKITPFVQENRENLWCYYCCSQSAGVANRFFAMPSSRSRILGVQLYLFDVKGFLHWGFNFWNTQYSKAAVDPYQVTDAGGAFPSGDPFLVCPGADGQPVGSIRLSVLVQMLCDLRAMRLLEGLTSRDTVVSLIRSIAGMDITFERYPQDAAFLIELRNAINEEIAKKVGWGKEA